MTRAEATRLRALQRARIEGIHRVATDRDGCIATLIRAAARRGNALRWFA